MASTITKIKELRLLLVTNVSSLSVGLDVTFEAEDPGGTEEEKGI